MVVRRRKSISHGFAVAYIRASTAEQNLSPAAQSAALDRWAHAEGVTLLAVFQDRGVSGGAEIADRPGLAAALAFLHEHRGAALVVAKRDRLARDVGISNEIERLAAKAGGRVLSADGSNGDDDGDALKRDLDAVLSAHERRVIRRRTRDAMAVKRAGNERLGGIPYGYRLAADGLHLEPDQAEQQVIARAKALSDLGHTVRKIAELLNTEGHRNRVGKPFAHQSIHVFLRPLIIE